MLRHLDPFCMFRRVYAYGLILEYPNILEIVENLIQYV